MGWRRIVLGAFGIATMVGVAVALKTGKIYNWGIGASPAVAERRANPGTYWLLLALAAAVAVVFIGLAFLPL